MYLVDLHVPTRRRSPQELNADLRSLADTGQAHCSDLAAATPGRLFDHILTYQTVQELSCGQTNNETTDKTTISLCYCCTARWQIYLHNHYIQVHCVAQLCGSNKQGDHSPDNVKFTDDSMTFPWQFAALLPMLSVNHIKLVSTSVIVSGGGRHATVHDPKPKWNAQAKQSQEWIQINSSRPLFPDFLLWHSQTFSKIPDSCQIPLYFQVFQTIGHPE